MTDPEVSEVSEVSEVMGVMEQPETSYALQEIDDDDDARGQNAGPQAVDDVDDSEVLRQARACCAHLEMQQALGVSATDFAAAGWGRC